MNRDAKTATVAVDLCRLFSLPLFGITLMFVVLGIVTSEASRPTLRLAALLIVALCWHAFGFGVNNLVDREVDATINRRCRDPLVRGTMLPVTATWVIGLVGLVALVVYWLRVGDTWGRLFLVLSMTAGVAYNVEGRRALPVMFDYVQGLAWGLFALSIARAVSSEMHCRVYASSLIFATVMIALTNGSFGGLRDLGNDRFHRRHTTATTWRPALHTGKSLPMTFIAYTVVLHLLQAAALVLLASFTSRIGWLVVFLVLFELALLAALLVALMRFSRGENYFRLGFVLLLGYVASPGIVYLGVGGEVLGVGAMLLMAVLWITTLTARRATRGQAV